MTGRRDTIWVDNNPGQPKQLTRKTYVAGNEKHGPSRQLKDFLARHTRRALNGDNTEGGVLGSPNRPGRWCDGSHNNVPRLVEKLEAGVR